MYLSYKLLYTLSIEENVHSVWIKYLKELFDETGYSSIWINQDIPNSNWLISSIKLRLHDTNPGMSHYIPCLIAE